MNPFTNRWAALLLVSAVVLIASELVGSAEGQGPLLRYVSALVDGQSAGEAEVLPASISEAPPPPSAPPIIVEDEFGPDDEEDQQDDPNAVSGPSGDANSSDVVEIIVPPAEGETGSPIDASDNPSA